MNLNTNLVTDSNQTISIATLMAFMSNYPESLPGETINGNLVVTGTATISGLTTLGTSSTTTAIIGTANITTASITSATVTTLGAGVTTITSANASALAVGLAGATNPAFVVDASTASQAAGLKVTGATAAGNVAVAVISSGAAANLLIDAKGTGTITIGSVSTGAVTITRALIASAGITVTGALSTTTTITAGTIVFAGDGAVATPSYSFTNQTGMGLYVVSATQMGFSIGGALKAMVDSNGLVTSQVSEQITNVGVTFNSMIVGAASTVDRPSLRIADGVAPTIPTDGDMWFIGDEMFRRIAGATKSVTFA